ncbi:hypothetical protein [Bradyrhizobium ottawaense]
MDIERAQLDTVVHNNRSSRSSQPFLNPLERSLADEFRNAGSDAMIG